MKIDFVLAGGTKSGTTSIYEALKNHPQVATSEKIKEPRYLSQGVFGEGHRGPERETKNIEDYIRLFPQKNQNNKYVGDFDVLTLHGPNSISLISQLNPSPKIILIFRSPIERAISHYFMDRREGLDERPFSKAIREDHRKMSDTYYHYSGIIRLGYYAEKTKAFLDAFGEKNTRIWIYEDLKNHPEATIREMCAHIGISTNFKSRILGLHLNSRSVPAGALSLKILQLRHRINHLYSPISKAAPTILKQIIKNRLTTKRLVFDEATDSDLQFLKTLYAQDIVALQSIIKRDLVGLWLDSGNKNAKVYGKNI